MQPLCGTFFRLFLRAPLVSFVVFFTGACLKASNARLQSLLRLSRSTLIDGGSGVVMVVECRIMFAVFRGVVGERRRCVVAVVGTVVYRSEPNAVDVRQIVDGMQIR